MRLGYFDLGVIAAYAALLLMLGVHWRRRAAAGLDHYLLAGRSKPWWTLGVSGVMDFWDLAGSIIIVSFLFLLGPAGLLVEFRGGAVLLLPVVMLWTGKWRRRSGCMTGAQWMRFRFGDGPAGKLAQSARAAGGIALFIGLVAYATKALGLFLSSLFPLTPEQSALAVVSLVAAYSVFSGFYGLVAIQGLQFVCVLASTVTLVSLAWLTSPPLQTLKQQAVAATGNPAWGELLPGDRLALPPDYVAYEPLLMLATIYLLRNLLFGMGAGDDQKCFAAQRDRDVPKLTLLWVSLMALRWPTMMAIAVLAITLADADRTSGINRAPAAAAVRGEYPEGTWDAVVTHISANPQDQPPELQDALLASLGPDWPRRLPEQTESGSLAPERLVPLVLERSVPAGLRGLVLVSLLAAATAGLSGWLNQSAGLFTNDIYLVWLRPSASVTEQIAATWVVVIAIVAGGYALAFSAPTVNDIWSWLTMGLGSGMIFAQALPLYWRRFNGVGYAAGLAGGLVAAVVQRLAAPHLPDSLAVIGQEWCLLLLVSVAGLLASLVGTWLSPPTSPGVLASFYLKTLPFGAWRTELQQLTTDQQRRLRGCHARELTALPIAVVYQVALFLCPMLLVIGDLTPAAVSGAIALASLAGLWLVYFRRLDNEESLVREVDAMRTSGEGNAAQPCDAAPPASGPDDSPANN
ncbi:MAG: hypothetical protein AAGJ46_10815 [Planctomycetota bacterium]